MKKGIKAILTGLSSALLLLPTLASCAKAPQEKGGTSSSNANKPATWIADRTIKIQVYVDDIGNSMPKDFNNTPTMKKITELTGIKLDVKYTPGDSDRKVLASQLASGSIPEVIFTYLDNSTRPEFPLLLKAAQEGMFLDVKDMMKNTKVFSKYFQEGYLPRDSYENVSFRKDLGGMMLWQLNIDAVDRSLEYIPEEEYRGGMYIQKRIVDKLGIDPQKIRSQEEFYDLLKKIKAEGFKDDNGNEVYPLGPKYWGGSTDALAYIIPGLRWGVSDFYNIDKDGKVKHEAELDSIYIQINYVRKLLSEGLMNPEFFTMDNTRAQEVSKTKNSAIIADVHNYEQIIYGNNDWVPLGPLNDISGNNKRVSHGKGARGCMAISSKAQNPEEIIRFFDWLSSKEGQLIAQYGAEGVTFDMVNGKPVLKKEVVDKLAEGDMDYLLNKVGAGLGGAGNYFFEFVLTDKDNRTNFGESRPGASGNKTFSRSVEIARQYPLEIKLVPGLNATAYMSSPELADVKMQMDLLNWKETLVQAFYAKSDDEVKKIIESFREQLKAAGVERFEDFVAKKYKEDKNSVNFFS